MGRLVWPAAAVSALLLATLFIWLVQTPDSPPTERTLAGLHGPVHSVFLYDLPEGNDNAARVLSRQDRFDTAGRLIDSTTFLPDGTIATRLTRTFESGLLVSEIREGDGRFHRDRHFHDAAGAWVRRERRVGNGELLEVKRLLRREAVPLRSLTEEYADRYDTGKWAKEVAIDAMAESGVIEAKDGTLLARWRKTSDSHGRLLESATWRNSGDSTARIRVYGADGLQRDTLIVDGVLRESAFFEADPDGNLVTTIVEHAVDGAPLRRVVEKRIGGRLTTRETLENSGITGWMELFEYPEQDSHGNWLTRETRDTHGVLRAKQLRRIRYF
ncbi:MAG: hypothetical protein VX663_06720 [Pseudomonadota bacterium]|nr:hypothetical protein [Pseudomonadota bacterium]